MVPPAANPATGVSLRVLQIGVGTRVLAEIWGERELIVGHRHHLRRRQRAGPSCRFAAAALGPASELTFEVGFSR
jgi:hypothetical protein